ncbi:hypothetical protein CYR32_05425 [Chimaeribacter coloradensis]|uniref:Uncharacterized protein n=2 Tax=Chimaeribacter coloradensis TaxID=2060068 RepID=A0A2N5E949_9GAMM|nr:hypothetical protein CYR32_05425 [Chimaeribacter coloradensis]
MELSAAMTVNSPCYPTKVRKCVLDALSINVNNNASLVGEDTLTAPRGPKEAHILTPLTAI